MLEPTRLLRLLPKLPRKWEWTKDAWSAHDAFECSVAPGARARAFRSGRGGWIVRTSFADDCRELYAMRPWVQYIEQSVGVVHPTLEDAIAFVEEALERLL